MTSPTRRIRIRNSAGWMDRPYICLSISVGKSAHEGADFAALVTAVRAAGKPILIGLSDTMQRHNFIAAGLSEEAAYAASLADGDAWIARNRAIIGDATIIRWDTWLKHPDYSLVYASLCDLYAGDSLFADTLDSDMANFLGRQSTPTPRMVECSRNFLLEEAAGYSLFGQRYDCTRLYPGRELETLALLRTDLVQGAPRGMDRIGYYRFTIETVKTPSMQHNFADMPRSNVA